MFAAPLLLALVPQSGLHVVDDDGGPGVAFTDLQPAIDAAADGDLILVRSGVYAPFEVAGRSLSIVADADADVRVVDPLVPEAQSSAATVTNIPDGGLVVLAGISFEGESGPGLMSRILPGGALAPGDWQQYGTLWIERCAVSGTAYPSLFLEALTPGVLFTSQRSLIIDTTTGTPGQRSATRGFESDLAPIYAYGSHFRGPLQPAEGTSGAGGRLVSASMLAVGSSFEPTVPDSGSPGLELFAQADLFQIPFWDTPSTAILLDSTADPIAGGPTSQVLQSVVSLPARTLTKPNVVRSGVPTSYAVGGTPGELAFLLLSTSFADQYFLDLKGLLAPLAPLIVPLGAVPSGGSISTPLTVTLPVGTTFVRLFEQAALVSPADGIVLSNPRAVFLLGPGL